MRLLAVVMSVSVVAGATAGRRPSAPRQNRKLRRRRCRLRSTKGPGGWRPCRAPTAGGARTEARRLPRGRGERLESSGNDVANTAVAALALLQAGRQYEPQVERALAFVLQRIEASPADGLAITDRQGTQIQRKLGPYIDTFLSSMLMSQVDGRASTPALNARVRKALQKTVAKIEKHQQSDGSWNIAGGWAPVLGTSMASRSLFEAANRGVAVDAAVMARAENYTVRSHQRRPAARRSRLGRWGGRRQTARCLDRRVRRSRRRPALSECAGAGAVEPHRGGQSEERQADQRDSGSARQCRLRRWIRVHGRRGVLLLSQHQRQHEARRRRRLVEMACGHHAEDCRPAEQRWHMGRSPLHHWTGSDDQRGDSQPHGRSCALTAASSC